MKVEKAYTLKNVTYNPVYTIDKNGNKKLKPNMSDQSRILDVLYYVGSDPASFDKFHGEGSCHLHAVGTSLKVAAAPDTKVMLGKIKEDGSPQYSDKEIILAARKWVSSEHRGGEQMISSLLRDGSITEQQAEDARTAQKFLSVMKQKQKSNKKQASN